MIDRTRLAKLMAIEEKRFLKTHPKSGELFEKAKLSMPGGVPMSWMSKWPGAYPVFVEEAKGASFIDVDGNTYVGEFIKLALIGMGFSLAFVFVKPLNVPSLFAGFVLAHIIGIVSFVRLSS